jgi:hypothetical protein
MNTYNKRAERGNGLVVTVSVVMTILAILGAAVSYTGHLSRISQRSRRTALAMEIADGHLEYLFTNWRNIYRTTWTTTSTGGTDDVVLATNYFFTDSYNPGPAPTPVPSMAPSATPPTIALPAKSNFPTEPNYNVTQYRIQAVDPMVSLDANENALVETSFGSGSYTSLSASATPPAAYGPNMMQTTGKKKTTTTNGQHSYFYLAAVDVNVPALGTGGGTVTAKVRRVFEKKFDLPWSYAVFYADDLEFQPTTSLTINGPIQSNGNVYIGSSNFTAADQLDSNGNLVANGRVGFGANYVNGFSPNDTYHSGSVTTPNFPANEPPSQASPFLPFGWNLASGEDYHDLIARPPGSGTDPISGIRYYNQADYRILIDASNNVTITDYNGSSITNGSAYNAITGAITTNQVIQDNREGTYVRLTTVDVASLTSNLNQLQAWNHTGTGGIIYISDTSAGTSVSTTYSGNTVSTSKRGVRLKNGSTLPSGGMTVVAENPVYIQGDYNTGGTPASDSGTFTSPTVSGYTRRDAAVIGDAINILSGAWVDTNSDKAIAQRVATSTTVNAALVTGEVPSASGYYSGGGENFVRFLEDWQKNSNTFTYYGSMVELFNSQQATGHWNASSNVAKVPSQHWYYDTGYQDSSPPGKLQIAAYLQQQRWYQVY